MTTNNDYQQIPQLLYLPVSPAERRVLKLIVLGYRDKEVARMVGIEHATVRTHVKRCMEKIKARNRAHLAYLVGCRILEFRENNDAEARKLLNSTV